MPPTRLSNCPDRQWRGGADLYLLRLLITTGNQMARNRNSKSTILVNTLFGAGSQANREWDEPISQLVLDHKLEIPKSGTTKSLEF